MVSLYRAARRASSCYLTKVYECCRVKIIESDKKHYPEGGLYRMLTLDRIYHAAFVLKDVARKTDLTLETLSGIRRLRLHVENGTVRRVTVDMGRPEVGDLLTGDAAVSTSFGRYEGRIVSMGNPHFVIFTPAVALVDLAAEGPLLERHERFPGRTNVEFAQVDGDVIRMRVWERGSGPTLACGTGACATAVAAIAAGLCDRQVTVRMDGGPLTIEWRADDGHVYMTGEARTVYEGTIHII